MKGKLFQLHAAFGASFALFVMGLLNVWPSYTSVIYSSNSTTPLSEPMTQAEISLLGSLPALGAMLGCACVGPLINKFGRRNGGIILSLPFVLSWTLISVTTSSKIVLAARFLGGIGGGSLMYTPILISEVVEDDFRGTLASGPMLLYTLGTVCSFILGWTMTYRTIVWINLVASVAVTLLIWSITETPVFLLKQKRDEEAKASIAHYRGCSPSSKVVLDEFSRLKQQLNPAVELISVSGDGGNTKLEEAEKEKLNSEYVQPEEQKKISPLKLLFTSPSSLRAFLVVMIVMSIQVMMGTVPVQVYAKSVFMKTDPEKSDLYTVMFALALLCGNVVTTAIADKAGRRILIISSSILVCIFVAIIGFLLQNSVAPPWVTVAIIMLYGVSFMSGAGSVPFVLVAEVFTSEVQDLASMLIIEWVWFMSFFILAVYPIMTDLLGIGGTFYCFAGFALLNAIISFFLVPETKGLSNEEIQEKFLGKRKA